MDGYLRLSPRERKICLKVYRRDRSVRRALVLLLLDRRRSYRDIGASVLVSPTLVAAVRRDFAAGGMDRVLGRERRSCVIAYWLILVAQFLIGHTPRDFGFFRSRWSCAVLALLVWERHRVRLSPETVRRGLHRIGFVWRRPRPVVGPHDPDHDRKIQRIQRLLRHLPADETAVFQDEVDVHLNPKIGSCWMLRAQQAEVATPGNNEKVHIAGSLHWRTGRLLLSAPGRQRNAALFVAHLDDLCRRLRGYRVVHVICDNARFHDCRAVRECLERHDGRLVLHYLPKYAPETNPIERIWWHLHETITRNHRCRSLPELLDEVYAWVECQQTFFIQTAHFRDTYRLAA
jgi:DDE superfamily endonuclease/Winged helix-turn helix